MKGVKKYMDPLDVAHLNVHKVYHIKGKLLVKLGCHGIRGEVYLWISNWLKYKKHSKNSLPVLPVEGGNLVVSPKSLCWGLCNFKPPLHVTFIIQLPS